MKSSNGPFNDKATTKFLSVLLRNKPLTIGLTLDVNGWVSTGELLTKMA